MFEVDVKNVTKGRGEGEEEGEEEEGTSSGLGFWLIWDQNNYL